MPYLLPCPLAPTSSPGARTRREMPFGNKPRLTSPDCTAHGMSQLLVQEALEKEWLLSMLMTRKWETRPAGALAAAMGVDPVKTKRYMNMLHHELHDTGNPKKSFTAHITRIVSQVHLAFHPRN